MTFETFLILLLITSSFTALVVEAIKKVMDEANKTYRANLLAGAVSVVVSVAVGAGYIILTETVINDKLAVYLIALVLLSWLSSMLGYDKIKQTIMQIRENK